MINIEIPPPDHPDVVAAHKLSTTILPMLAHSDPFVVGCAFGWLLGQIVKNDKELYKSVDAVKEAGEASLWAREDNGYV